MLTSRLQRGVGLIEVMVVVIIMAIVMAAAAPNFGPWMAGMRIRSTAESLLAGLQYAKSEATTRNARVRFQLTSSLGSDCVLDSRAANWVVDVVDADVDAATDSVSGQCNAAPSDTTPPSILQVRSATETGGRVQVVANSAEIVFNGLGRQVPLGGVAAAANVNIEITPSGGTCAAAGGKVTCLRVTISPAGQVRMCNPSVADGDPQAC